MPVNYVIILAGGTGSRAGGPLPKQFQEIGGKRIIWWSVEAFKRFDPQCKIVMAVHPDYLDKWEDIFGKEVAALGCEIIKTKGGKNRIESVKNALKAIEDKEGFDGLNSSHRIVYIHDAARPFVSVDLIARGSKVVKKGIGAVPVVPVTDSIRRLSYGGSESVDRNNYVAVQTPQIFYYDDIRKAYDSLEEEQGLTDDASVGEKFGLAIDLYEGDPANRKITNPSDFKI